jgi:hypothetical protein
LRLLVLPRACLSERHFNSRGLLGRLVATPATATGSADLASAWSQTSRPIFSPAHQLKKSARRSRSSDDTSATWAVPARSRRRRNASSPGAGRVIFRFLVVDAPQTSKQDLLDRQYRTVACQGDRKPALLGRRVRDSRSAAAAVQGPCLASTRNATDCDGSCEWQKPADHRIFERTSAPSGNCSEGMLGRVLHLACACGTAESSCRTRMRWGGKHCRSLSERPLCQRLIGQLHRPVRGHCTAGYQPRKHRFNADRRGGLGWP